jgi:heme exporter protein CcmD
MTHAGYIAAAYLASLLVVAGMIAGVLLDLAAQKRKLARLEEAGLGRRSEVLR